MLATSALLACHLLASTAASVASAGSAFGVTVLSGVWELTGIGAPHNLTVPQKVVLVFDPVGGFRMSVWERGDVVPYEVAGRSTMSGNLLTLTVQGSGPPQEFRVAWSPSALVLQPVEDLNQRPSPALHLEKRPWISP